MTADEEASQPGAEAEPEDPVEPEAAAEPDLDPADAEEEPMRVRADQNPVEDEPETDPETEQEPEPGFDSEPEPDPNPYEAGHGAEAAEPGLMGLLLRAGDRLAYEGDRWEARIRDDPEAHPTPPPPPVWVGTFTLAGTEIPWNMHEWSPDHRRGASLVAAAVTSFLVVLGIATQFVAPDASWFLTLLLVGVVVAFAFELAVFLTAEPRVQPAREPAPAGATAAGAGAAGAGAAGGAATQETTWEEPDEETAPPDEDEPLDILTLKCSDCGEVFDVEDHGERPLTHTCPGCGADGEIPASELPDPADLRDEPEDPADEGDEPDAPAGEIPRETGDPIPEFDLDDEDDPD